MATFFCCNGQGIYREMWPLIGISTVRWKRLKVRRVVSVVIKKARIKLELLRTFCQWCSLFQFVCLFHVKQNKICNILLSFLSICCLVRVKCTIDKTSVFFMSAESHWWTISSWWGAGERKSNDFCVWSCHWGSSHCAGQLTNPLRPLNLGPLIMRLTS